MKTSKNNHPGSKYRRKHCPATGKARFRDHEHAVDALRASAWSRYRAEHDGVTTRRQERRSYHCTWCNGWHLTSTAEPPAGIAA